MNLGIKGKKALITGGSRGLGLASAVSLAKEGADLAICARDKSDLENAKNQLNEEQQSIEDIINIFSSKNLNLNTNIIQNC